MTTIAFDGQTVAFDTLTAQSGRKGWTHDKVIRVEGGSFAGGCGELDAIHAFQSWVQNGMDPSDYPQLCRDRSEESCFIVITPDGVLMDFERTPTPVTKTHGFDACGSGSDYALGAMAAGKTAREAVEIAARFDLYTGSEVIALPLDAARTT
jgi:hypothetical protein